MSDENKKTLDTKSTIGKSSEPTIWNTIGISIILIIFTELITRFIITQYLSGDRQLAEGFKNSVMVMFVFQLFISLIIIFIYTISSLNLNEENNMKRFKYILGIVTSYHLLMIILFNIIWEVLKFIWKQIVSGVKYH
tara:strand:- start:33 stop:443 length:411 start_codon:yes stop_codon:yes gene_type:complete